MSPEQKKHEEIMPRYLMVKLLKTSGQENC